MRLPALDRDSFELVSAEQKHQASPATFWLPPEAERQNLQRGQAAKLLFDILVQTETGAHEIGTERMWVIVAGRTSTGYIGILDSQPASTRPDHYLVFGAEVPFQAEHICDIGAPPKEYAEWQLSQAPERLWPRQED
ncbi:hypothetical protein GO986_01710 [Deinococcus sp. HMF7620]|uniref:DUF2314 domain-containing protein n=1 Tax=Deinococcus arboris TaxID=2682977 RepID=A0A7C9LRI9_9DEIO|nr:hypothetical protein [Deinococcus arboris]MVN85480.1 hypothetical protein [Deinococcus arboris]